MPFHGHFSNPNSLLVESSSIYTTHATVLSLASGDVAIHATNSTGGPSTAAIAVTLPAVTQGGIVTFKETSTVGTATIKSLETSGVYIDGTAGTTGVTVNTVTDVTYISDGANWWKVIG